MPARLDRYLVENRSEPASRHGFAEHHARGVHNDEAVGRPGKRLLWDVEDDHTSRMELFGSYTLGRNRQTLWPALPMPTNTTTFGKRR